MKAKKNYIKNYFKIGLFLFLILSIFINCEKDDDFLKENINQQNPKSKNKIRRVSLDDILNNKKCQKPLAKLASKLDVNKRDVNGRIGANDGSFTILTDEIVQVSTDSTETYTFKIEKNVLPQSHFENFVIDITPQQTTYKIMSYTYNSEVSQENFQYIPTMIPIREEDLDLDNLDNRTMSYQVIIGGFLYTFEWFCEDCEGGGAGGWWEAVSVTWVGESNNNGDTNGNYNSNSDIPHDYMPYDNDSEGGGGSAVNNIPFSFSPFVVVFIPYDQQIRNCIGDYILNGNYAINNWLSNNENSILFKNIASFLDSNDCSEEAQEFAILVMEAPEGSEIDYDEQIIVGPTFSDYPCQKKIVESVYQNNSLLSNYILDIFDTTDKVNLTYNLTDLDQLDGNCISPLSPNTFGNYNVNIHLDLQCATGASDLFIAAIMIHENLHAVLRALTSEGFLTNVNSNDLTDLAEAYAAWRALNSNQDQHHYMSTLVDKMAESLKAYGISKGYNIPDEYYNDICWTGKIKATSAFDSLPSSKQYNINQAYLNERVITTPTSTSGTFPVTPCN